MKMAELRRIAKKMGLNVSLDAKKADIIHAIQRAEGNSACFQALKDACNQYVCLFRADCLQLAAQK